MNERKVQRLLCPELRRKGHDLVCPNYTPPGWFECDLFSITKAGNMVEHEIKLSAADFRADVKKGFTVYDPEEVGAARFKTVTKHARLMLGDVKGPARFWYVMPRDLVPLAKVPEFAGVLWIDWQVYEDGGHKHLWAKFDTAKKAPRLHTEPCRPVVLRHLPHIFCWRFWAARGVRDPGAEPEYQI